MDPSQIPIRDLHLPEAIGWWPFAPGWWIVIGLAVVASLFLLRRALIVRRRNSARRYALAQLKQFCDDYARHGSAVELGTHLSELVRRTMLAYAPRAEVAGLTGEAWLEWLDADLDRPHFAAGDGRPLAEWPYRDPGFRVDRSDVGAFVDAVRLRLSTPVGGRS
ncbi:MAG: DUF4381 domain-containing protein [Woeseiaceae bacterium]